MSETYSYHGRGRNDWQGPWLRLRIKLHSRLADSLKQRASKPNALAQGPVSP